MCPFVLFQTALTEILLKGIIFVSLILQSGDRPPATREPLAGDKAQDGEDDHNLILVLRIRKDDALPPLPLYTFME
jgi:hypothetical protein